MINYHFYVLYFLCLKTGHTLMHLGKVLPKVKAAGACRERAGRLCPVRGRGSPRPSAPPAAASAEGTLGWGPRAAGRAPTQRCSHKGKRRGMERRKTSKTNPKFITTEVARKLPTLSLFLREHEFLSNLVFFLKTLKLEENRPLDMCFHIHFFTGGRHILALISISRSSAHTLGLH